MLDKSNAAGACFDYMKSGISYVGCADMLLEKDDLLMAPIYQLP